MNRRHDARYFLLLFVYKVLLDFSYLAIIAPKFGYMGFALDPGVHWYAFGFVLFCLFAVINEPHYYNRTDALSSEVLNILSLFAAIPFTVMVGWGSFGVPFILANSVFWLMLYFFVARLKTVRGGKRRYAIGFHILGQREIHAITVVSLLIVIFISGRYAHFRFLTSFRSVYEYRAEAYGFNLPASLSYLFSWSRAVNTILIAYYFREKRYWMVALCVFTQLLSFSIDGSKSVLFFALCAVLINVVPLQKPEKINFLMLLGMIGLVGVCLFIYLASGNYSLASLFVRRTIFFPVRIEECYYDFFTTHTPDFFKASFLRHFGAKTSYPNLAHIIGEVYFNAPAMGANNGLISDAMANWGIAGTLIHPLLYSAVLCTIDGIIQGQDIRFYLTAALFIGMGWVNSFLLTTLLTHGILVMMLLLVLISQSSRPEARSYRTRLKLRPSKTI